MRPIEELLPHVFQYASGVPEPMAVDHLRKAAVRFCKATRAWRSHDCFDTADCGPEPVCTPPQAVLFEIEWARFDDKPLEPSEYGDDRYMHDEGQPRYYTQTSPNTVKIEPFNIGMLSLSMFLHPAPDADYLPPHLIDNFGMDLGNGALASLLLLPNQPFSNPQLAIVFEQKFTAVLDRNFAYNVRGQTRGRIRTKPNYL